MAQNRENPSSKQIGQFGENIVVRFLVKHGFAVIRRNYRGKHGEIDVITIKSGILYIFEVKALQVRHVTHETREVATYRGSELVNARKRMKIRGALRQFLAESHVSHETLLEFYVAIVAIDLRKCRSSISLVRDVL